jgi:hypothetical protein
MGHLISNVGKFSSSKSESNAKLTAQYKLKHVQGLSQVEGKKGMDALMNARARSRHREIELFRFDRPPLRSRATPTPPIAGTSTTPLGKPNRQLAIHHLDWAVLHHRWTTTGYSDYIRRQ